MRVRRNEMANAMAIFYFYVSNVTQETRTRTRMPREKKLIREV